jgi:glycosyltransferase involved in cell wall biosynthesis
LLPGLIGHLWEQTILPRRILRDQLLWSPANTGPLLVTNQVLSIHDVTPLEHPEWFRPAFAAWYRLFWPVLIRRIHKILVPSEHVRQRLVAHFSVKRLAVIPEGVDVDVFHPDARRPCMELPQQYVLFLGSIEPRKNLRALLQAWDQVKGDFRDIWLVIAGDAGRVFKPVELQRNMDRVRLLGYVPETDLPGLYAHAVLFVLPSLEEGFGLPILEAMASGVPVLASDGGALPETTGEAGLIFPLSDPRRLTDSLRTCLSDAGLRATMKEAGLARARMFTWRRTAQRVWEELHAS